MASASDIVKRIKDEEIEWVDLRFTDPKGKWQHLSMVAGVIDEDALDLHVLASADGAQARLVAVLANLGKGASGAAVQSLNLMAGLDETAGLRFDA